MFEPRTVCPNHFHDSVFRTFYDDRTADYSDDYSDECSGTTPTTHSNMDSDTVHAPLLSASTALPVNRQCANGFHQATNKLELCGMANTIPHARVEPSILECPTIWYHKQHNSNALVRKARKHESSQRKKRISN